MRKKTAGWFFYAGGPSRPYVAMIPNFSQR